MERLTNQQLILVALLISFVTSLATGIFTVSLMSQAPENVVQTINHVVERTIEKAVPADATLASVNASTDQVAKASSRVLKGVVKLRSKDFNKVSGLGLILNSQGVILADKSSVAQLPNYEAVFPDGRAISVSVIQSQLNGNIIFLAPTVNAPKIAGTFTSLVMASSTNIGQDVFSLSVIGTSTPLLGQGILTSIVLDENSTEPVTSTIASARLLPGSPLFNNKGELIGVHMADMAAENGSSFYPLSSLLSVIPSM
jgi:hypothetical protein